MLSPWQRAAWPVIAPAAPGTWLIVTGKGGELGPFPQTLFPETSMFPEAAVEEKLTVTEFVPAPEAMLAPVGSVQT